MIYRHSQMSEKYYLLNFLFKDTIFQIVYFLQKVLPGVTSPLSCSVVARSINTCTTDLIANRKDPCRGLFANSILFSNHRLCFDVYSVSSTDIYYICKHRNMIIDLAPFHCTCRYFFKLLIKKLS